jgi:HprK-related kinase A
MIATRTRPSTGRFRIGDQDVVVRSELPEALTDFAALYPQCAGAAPDSRTAIAMEVKRSGRTRLGRRRFDIHGDGEALHRDLRADEVLPHLEWGISWRIVARRGDFLQVHAASMARDGRGVVLAGASGAGKSTLVAGLLARGWDYLCDEFALINPDTLMLHPYPKAVCIKAGSFDAVRRLGLSFSRDRHYAKAIKGRVGYINPADLGSNVAGGPCPVRHVFFPHYGGDGEPRARRVPPASAVFGLLSQVLNRDAFADRAVGLLSRVVRGARCFGLESGPLEPTCDLIESLID